MNTLKKHTSFTFSSFRDLLSSLLHNIILISHLNPFYLQLIYLITLSSLGFLALKSTKPRYQPNKPNDINLFFTSVSASTLSSMSTVEMEVFSDTQLVFLTVLMLLGGEVFTSMLGLHLMGAKKERMLVSSNNSYDNITTHIELGTARVEKPDDLELKSIKLLAYLVSCYLLVAHTIGSALVAVYLSTVPGAKRVLETKGIKLLTFSVFTTVSTFSNCGFVPTNENMAVFRNNPGLLLILIPQVLMGNTLYPIVLRLSIWVTAKMTRRRSELRYMLENSRELGYGEHLVPAGLNAVCVGITCLGLMAVQMVVFCSMEWRSESSVGGLNNVYEKVVGIVFQVVNSRHAGESVFDLSALSPAILVMFVLMMYLPPYTSYLGIEQAETGRGETNRKKAFWELTRFSNLTYLVIFIFLICVTERHKIKRDPLNFNVLNIVVEVVSAYGNVGFTVGYSCQRQIHPDGDCENAWYGFVGKWSDEGKFLLVIVMFVGRLKKFNKRGGRAWSLA